MFPQTFVLPVCTVLSVQFTRSNCSIVSCAVQCALIFAARNFRPLCWVWPSICAFNKSQGRFKACNFTLFYRSVFLHMRVYWYSLYSTIGDDCHQALRDYRLLILNYHDFISSRRIIKLIEAIKKLGEQELRTIRPNTTNHSSKNCKV